MRLAPPDAEVDDLLQAGRRVGELTLVDDETGVGTTRSDGVEDPVERHDDVGERAAEEQPQRQEGRGQRAGDRDRDSP